MEKRSKEELHAFIEGFEQCANFAYNFMNKEGIEKIKLTLRSIKLSLEDYEIVEKYLEKYDVKEEAHENKVQSSQGNNGQA